MPCPSSLTTMRTPSAPTSHDSCSVASSGFPLAVRVQQRELRLPPQLRHQRLAAGLAVQQQRPVATARRRISGQQRAQLEPLVGRARIGVAQGAGRAYRRARAAADAELGIDDDALAFYHLQKELGAEAVLLTVADAETRRRFPQTADGARPPSMDEIARSIDALNARMDAAARTGATHAQATRAVALTSPRTAWDEGGAPGTTDYKMPNVESAEAVIRAVNGLRDPSTEQVRQAARKAKGGTAIEGMKAKAGEYHAQVPTTSPIETAVPASQKVPNFEQSLHLGHVDPAVVRGAAGSYTVDGWDVKGIGGDEKLLKSDAGYAVAHMTGVRSALKNRELPPNFQASTWNSLRDQPGAYGSSPASMGTNRLFVSQRSGRLAPNPNAMAPERESTFHALSALNTRTQRRGQGAAAKYDLEF